MDEKVIFNMTFRNVSFSKGQFSGFSKGMEKGLVKHFDRSESLALPIKKKSYSQVIPFDQKGGGVDRDTEA